MRGLIIDGVVASGKSTILHILNKKIIEEEPTLSKIFLSEHYTQRMLEHLRDGKKIDGQYINNHIEKIIDSLDVFQKMLDDSKFRDNPKEADLLVILERFILTHLTNDDLLNDGYSLEKAKYHFSKITSYNINQIALIIPEDKIEKRIMSTINYRNEKWKEYLYSFGDEKEIVNYYKNWQRRFLGYINQCRDIINTVIVEIKDDDFEYYSEVIFNELFKQ